MHQQLDHDPGKLDEEIVSHTESLPDVSEERGEDTTAGSGKGTDVRGGKSGLGRFLWPARGQSLEEDTCQLVSLVEAAAAPGGAGVAAEAKATVHEASTNKVPATSPKSDDEVESLRALDKKILRELTSELCSGGFYFSQDFDLTTCMQAKWQNLAHEVDTARNATSAHAGHSSRTAENNAHNSPRGTADIRKDEPRISEPLTSRADRRFWYNRWLSKDIVESGVSPQQQLSVFGR